jgi:pilus assembly protein CpaF
MTQLSEFEAAYRQFTAAKSLISVLDPRTTTGPRPFDEFKNDALKEAPADVIERLELEVFGAGPLESLINDPAITEIMVNRHDQIFFEQNGQVKKHADHFSSELSYKNFVTRFSVENSLNLDLDRPTGNGRWRNFRFHLLQPPLSKSFVLTFRRQRFFAAGLHHFRTDTWAPGKALDLISHWVRGKKNVLVVGPTNTGKTTLLSGLLSLLPDTDRVVVIEDTDEVVPPNPLAVKLLTRDGRGSNLKTIAQSDLVVEALRMRPDRLVMGEMRGAEAKDYLLALSTGHGGSLATLHAENPLQALLRLEFLIQMGAPNWSVHAIKQLIRLSLHHVVVLENKNGHRRLKGLYTLTGLESTGFCLHPEYERQDSSVP